MRLAGIAAREIDGTCRSSQPCHHLNPQIARDALARLVGVPLGMGRNGHRLVRGDKLHCSSLGGAGGNRTAAWCFSARTGDISCAMVSGGWALRWDRYWRDHRCRP